MRSDTGTEERRHEAPRRRNGGLIAALLLIVVVAALVIGGFFLLGGDGDVDVDNGDVDVTLPEADVDVNAPDIDVESPDVSVDPGGVDSEEAPEADADAWLERLRAHLNIHMPHYAEADVPVGALLSGGSGAKKGAVVGLLGGVVYDIATRNR